MASNDRFYQLELRQRPALWGDIGSLLKIEGIVIGGAGAQAILMLPSADVLAKDALEDLGDSAPRFISLSAAEWSEWLRQSDNPEVLVNGSLEKAFHRKLRYDISGHTQQKVWVADGLKCMYCQRSMGEVQLTIDHFIPLEQGGKNDPSNYLSACRKCNKDKGNTDPETWCRSRKGGASYQFYVDYLADRKIR